MWVPLHFLHVKLPSEYYIWEIQYMLYIFTIWIYMYVCKIYVLLIKIIICLIPGAGEGREDKS